MRIAIGKTRSGRLIEIETEAVVRARQFLADYSSLEDRFDAFCVALFLRRQEKSGWQLTAAPSHALFDRLCVEVELDSVTPLAIAVSRRSGLSESAFRDLEHGRQMTLAGLRR